MRGKVAKRLRLIARLASGGKPEEFERVYASVKKAWVEAGRSGAIKKMGRQVERQEAAD